MQLPGIAMLQEESERRGLHEIPAGARALCHIAYHYYYYFYELLLGILLLLLLLPLLPLLLLLLLLLLLRRLLLLHGCGFAAGGHGTRMEDVRVQRARRFRCARSLDSASRTLP